MPPKKITKTKTETKTSEGDNSPGKKPAPRKAKTKKDEREETRKRLADLIDQRNKATQARVDKLTVEQMKKLITDMMKRDPSFVFHVMEENKSSRIRKN